MTRGYCAVGVINPKSEVNVGTLWRSASSLGASWMFTVGRRYQRQVSDTAKAWRHIPLFNFDDFDDLRRHLPYACQLVGVEIDNRARALARTEHPERACYLLGAEDNGIPPRVRDRCHQLVQLPGEHCLNVAVAGSIVLYDRRVRRHEAL